MRKGKILINLDGIVSVICLGVMLCTILVQVILRFAFSKPLMGAEEFTRYMVICVVMLPLAFSERSGSAIIMEEVQAMLPTSLKRFINQSAQIMTTMIYFILSVSAISVVINNAQNKTATLEMPFWLFLAPTVLGFIAMTITRIIIVFCNITKRELPWALQ